MGDLRDGQRNDSLRLRRRRSRRAVETRCREGASRAAHRAPGPSGDTISSGNTQDADVEQEASAGAGGNAGNQAAIVQQNAGDDAIGEVNQSQNFNAGGAVTHGRVHGHGQFHGHGGRVHGVGGGVGVSGGGVGVGGGVGGVTLARTGFDAWVLVLVGGAVVAGGLALLAAQRRGRLTP